MRLGRQSENNTEKRIAILPWSDIDDDNDDSANCIRWAHAFQLQIERIFDAINQTCPIILV